MKLAFVVCGNGYGHLKRVCVVVAEIFKAAPGTHVLLIGSGPHEAMLKAWGYTQAFQTYTFSFVNGKLEQGLKATIDPAYTFEAYRHSFEPTLRALYTFGPDHVISDNLAGILAHYPRTLLMGSFLWSDILSEKYAGNENIEKICTYEAALVKRHNPVMLGLEDMVMPYVKAHTRFTGLPWFCTPTGERISSLSNTILITGGGTANAQERLHAIARTVQRSGQFNIVLDRALYTSLSDSERPRFTVFDFSSVGFHSLAWIICRPGIGILTDAVQYGVPVCVVGEHDPEMNFNSVRVETLGIGVVASARADAIPEQLTSATRIASAEKIRALKTGGAALAAAYILNS